MEYDENVVPLIEWCTTPEWCADGLVSDWLICPGLLFYYWRAARSPIALGLQCDFGLHEDYRIGLVREGLCQDV